MDRAVFSLIFLYIFLVSSVVASSLPSIYYHRPDYVKNKTKELVEFYRSIPRKMKVSGRRPSVEGKYASSVLRNLAYVVYIHSKVTEKDPADIATKIMRSTGKKPVLEYILDKYSIYFTNGRQEYLIDNTGNKYLDILKTTLDAYNGDLITLNKHKSIEVYGHDTEKTISERLKAISRLRGYIR